MIICSHMIAPKRGAHLPRTCSRSGQYQECRNHQPSAVIKYQGVRDELDYHLHWSAWGR
jgi:hypothetical protein